MIVNHQEQLISFEITSAVSQKLFHSHRLFFQLRNIAAHNWIKSIFSWWVFHIDCFPSFKRFWKSSHLNQIFSMQLFFPDGVFSAGSLPLVAVVASGRHAQSPSSPSLTFLCHSRLYHIWLPSKMSTLSHSYLPNLQVLLLLPFFATLDSTIYGYPQKCPPYLTHICPISKFSFSYLSLPL